jgi:ankyrin repeat protein
MKLEKFTELLRQRDDIEQRDQKGRTALFRAARIGKSDIVRLLLDHGANSNAEDKTGEAPLQTASRYGHQECVEMLIAAGAKLDHCPAPETTEYSETALCSAARKHPEIAKTLLRHGANPNAASSAGRLPLIYAAADENSLDILVALLEAGARVNEQDGQGRTALHAAIDAGSVTLVKLLLANGADPEIEADHAGTALCAALLNYEADRASLVLALLAARPNLAAVCPSWKMTPIELARQFYLPEVVEILTLAGSPRPKPEEDLDSESTILEIETPEGPAQVRICFRSPSVEPNHDDRKLAQEVCGKGPTLSQRFGWRASPRHWGIIQVLTKQSEPIPLARIAYFVRGYLNAPRGKELEDGPVFLGESYQDAMNRFLEEGLVGTIPVEHAIALSSSAPDLKNFAKKQGIKTSGTKPELVDRLAQQFGVDRVAESLSPHAHYVITLEGQSSLAEQERHRNKVAETLRRELLDLLSEGEFRWSCHLARDLGLLVQTSASRCSRITPEQMASRIALARETLAAPLPPGLDEFAPLEDRLRFIAAAVSLIGDQDNDWRIWDFRLQPIHSIDGELLTPTEFRVQILMDDANF